MTSTAARAARVLVTLAAWLAAAGGPALALESRQPLSRHGHDVWQQGDGLPQNSVEALAQTPDGYLWIGTEEGLARFDGVRFTVFVQQNTPGLRHNSIKSLLVASDGSLWIGTNGGGLSRLANGEFTAFSPNGWRTGLTVRAIAEDHRGHLWVGANDGLYRFNGSAFVAYGPAEGLPRRSVRTICVDRDGAIWVGMGRGAFVLRAGRFEPANVGTRVRSIVQASDGAMWFATSSAGLVRLKDGRSTRYGAREGLPSDEAEVVREDRDGNVWVGINGHGLARWTPDSVGTFGRADGLSSGFVRALLEDREGNLWIGTEGGGLNRLRDSRVTVLDTDDGVPADFVRAVREDRNGRMWVASDWGGLARFDGDARQGLLTARDGLPPVVYALFEDSRGRVWLGTDGRGLLEVRGHRVVPFAANGDLPSATVFCLQEDRRGQLWIGTSDGLAVVAEGVVRRPESTAPLANAFVTTLHHDARGRLWIGARNLGLWRLDGDALVRLGADQGTGDVSVSAFHEDPDGTVWAASRGGLLRIDESGVRRFTTRDGLLTDNLYGLVDDRRGWLWLSSTTGVFRVAKADLDRLARLGGQPVTSIAFDTADGMKVGEATGGGFPSAWRARDGRLWFPTPRGVVVVDPNREPALAASPPPVVIEEVTADDRALAPDAEIPPSTRTLRVRYSALTFVAPAKVRFRFRLDGHGDWVDAGTHREAIYTDLPHGRYLFRVVAADREGGWSGAGASFAFAVRPPFYRSAWFLGVSLAALAAAVWLAHRYRVRAMRQRFEAVLAERGRLARELHDTLLQGFAGVSLQLDVVRHKLRQSAAAAEEQLDKVLGQVDGCLTEARRSIWDMRALALEEGDLVLALQKVARQVSERSPVRVQVEVEGERRRLPAAIEGDLLRIGQEATANAVRYAQPQLVSIEVRFERRRVWLSVRDDGRGFEADRAGSSLAPGGYGLRGMRERVERLGGRFSLQSLPGAGTTVEVSVPLRG